MFVRYAQQAQKRIDTNKGEERMIKQLFIDTETTGVDRDLSGVWQIGGIIKVGKREEEFEINCDIFEEDEINPKAFETNDMTLEKIAKFQPPEKALEQLIGILDKYVDKYDKKDKFIVLGYGAEFDQQILRNWFYKLGDDYFGSWIWHPWIDIMVLAQYVLQGVRPNLENFKQRTVADYLQIRTDETKLHSALYDAQIARKIYNKLEMIQKESF